MILGTIKYAAAGGEWVSPTISAIGNILGGMIGGFVAYFAASYQVRSMLLNEQKNQQQMSDTVLALIGEELRKNTAITKEVVPYKPEFEANVRMLADHVWQSSFRYLVIPSELLIRINACYNLIGLCRTTNIINDDLLNRTSEFAAKTIQDINAYFLNKEVFN